MQTSKFYETITFFKIDISTIGVLPEFRKKGLGSKLLHTMCKILNENGANHITLHVKTLNEGAIEFYKKEGFKIKQTLSQHYFIKGKFYDALWMCKSLNENHSENLYTFEEGPLQPPSSPRKKFKFIIIFVLVILFLFLFFFIQE